MTVGRHGVITADEARRRAALIVARIKAGEEAIPEPMAVKLAEGQTVGELAGRYLEQHVAVRCKPKTESMYRLVVAKYILPELGKRPVLAVSHKEVTEIHHRLSAKPVMANHVVDTLSRIYNAAEDRGDIPEASNPCRLVVKNRERKRERFLTDEEFRRLGRVLDEAERCKGVSVHAVAAIRLLLLTGWSNDPCEVLGVAVEERSLPKVHRSGVDFRAASVGTAGREPVPGWGAYTDCNPQTHDQSGPFGESSPATSAG